MTPTASPQRRIDLDWLRILAFGSLILYHVGMYYVTWDWHVKSPAASRAAEPLMLLVNPWRLALLFLVSGVATAYIAARMEGAPAPPQGLRYLQRVAFALDQWAFIVAACGFARRHLTRDGPARRYLTEAIFPFYIIHQTAIIAIAVWMRPLALPPAAEAGLLIVLVALVCVATYEVVKRVAPLRPLFGLKARAALCSPDAQRQ